MSVAYQSIGQSPGATSTSCVITKPSGLAVGDLMIAIISVRSPSTTITPASGFTLVKAETGGSTIGLHTYYKVADSGDAAATDFTFTLSGSQRNLGTIVRMNGQATSSIIENSSSGFNDANDTSVSFTGFTPSTAGTAYVLATADTQAAGSFSGQAMTTDDPTFTERFDGVYTDTSSLRLAVATANFRTQTSATGDFLATHGSDLWVGVAIAINQPASVSSSPGVVTLTLSVPTASVSINMTLSAVTLTFTTPTVTVEAIVNPTNQTKNVETFANTSKNNASPSNTSKNVETWTNTQKT